ncbi:hypothetical protein LY78DRAFT_745300 [Colletotrichum sublineola]|nr:hypothetical protein LY78DRAFT_745300 [Colletotrichum sublineola]
MVVKTEWRKTTDHKAPSFRIVPERSEQRLSDDLDRKTTLSSRLKAVFPSRRAEKASKGEKTLEERRLAQLERRTLKESGDYLGVTGINPTTGELDVLTPSTTSFSSASLAIDQTLDSHKKTKIKTTKSRRGAELLTEEVTQKLQQREEERFSRKDQEKEAIRQAQRNVRPIAQSIKSISTRESETKDKERYLPKVGDVQHILQTEMGHTNPMYHLPKHLISEDDGADSSNTVIRTPQRRRSSFVTPEIDDKLGSGTTFGNGSYAVIEQVPAGVVESASPQVQIASSSPIAEQIALGGSSLDHPQFTKQARQGHQEFEIPAPTEVLEDQPLGVTCQLTGERQLEPSIQHSVETCSPRATVTTSASESSLMFQSPSVALDTWNEGSMAKHRFNKLTSNYLKGIKEPSNRVNEPWVNKSMFPDAAESQENLPCFGAQREKKDPTARHATTPIITTIGLDQGRYLLSPYQIQLEKNSESWSLLQNWHVSRRHDSRMSTSTEDISTDSVHQLANVKRRTRDLAPKGSAAAATRLQEAAIQLEVRKSFVKNLPGKELKEDQTDKFVTSHRSTSTSPLSAWEEATQWNQSEEVSLRAAMADSGSKMAQTRKRHHPEREDIRVLPLSLRKPHANYVPFRRLRSSFNLVRRLDKGQQKLMEVPETNRDQSPEMPPIRTGGGVNRQITRTTSKALSSTRLVRSKAGYSTLSALAKEGSEVGGIESRLRRETFNKHVLKCATDGKQIAEILARWYWTVISPCFDPISPVRKRLEGNKSTWTDFGLFVFALGSGFMLLAMAVRIAQGIALLMQMVHFVLVGLIAILGS